MQTCEGDCDSDSDCAGSLKCFQRSSKREAVPGCANNADVPGNYDFCYAAPTTAAPTTMTTTTTTTTTAATVPISGSSGVTVLYEVLKPTASAAQSVQTAMAALDTSTFVSTLKATMAAANLTPPPALAAAIVVAPQVEATIDDRTAPISLDMLRKIPAHATLCEHMGCRFGAGKILVHHHKRETRQSGADCAYWKKGCTKRHFCKAHGARVGNTDDAAATRSCHCFCWDISDEDSIIGALRGGN
jgi:hypothetical protein